MEREVSCSTEDLISSSGFLEEHAYGADNEMEEENVEDMLDDILDLAGGARDAIERHKSEQNSVDTKNISSSPEGTETPSTSTPTGHSQLLELLYWRDVQRSGCVFGASLFMMISLSMFSVISVFSNIVLALLSISISFRMYRGVTAALQKSENAHPFRSYLEQDVILSDDVIHKYTDVVLMYCNDGMKELKRLFLVENLIDSLKLAVLLWIMTYVGAVFNALTLLIIGDVAAFTLPIFYTKYKTQIDHYYTLLNNNVQNVVKKIRMMIPGAKNKTE
ncbi:reticulon-3-B-like [Trichomycterus rosablanca]|uniref:reticulon-3-B-like n=1 Tax=Trichomycterus rosablanca TaxID=2290929 RepID=UPI002F352DB8